VIYQKDCLQKTSPYKERMELALWSWSGGL